MAAATMAPCCGKPSGITPNTKSRSEPLAPLLKCLMPLKKYPPSSAGVAVTFQSRMWLLFSLEAFPVHQLFSAS
ncbi:Uncharacterised protein [Mycobacteroides abscessus subsp. abscessus]|nr:Uncharacterised protein [Mycobacteroides abscessus subsp. abscessus]